MKKSVPELRQRQCIEKSIGKLKGRVQSSSIVFLGVTGVTASKFE